MAYRSSMTFTLFSAFLLVLAGCANAADNDVATQHQHEAAHPHDHLTIPDMESHHLAAKPWTSLDIQDDPDKFQFLIMTDRTGEARDGVFEDAAEKVNLLQPAFVMSVGDLIQGYTDDEDILNAQWNDFDAIVKGMQAPFFYVPGNHDWQPSGEGFENDAMPKVWTERLGRSYYHFVYKDTLFLILNAELFDRTGAPWWTFPWRQRHAKEQKAQLAYIDQVLKDNKDVRWTFVFTHKPYWKPNFIKPAAGEQSPATGPWPRYDYVPPEWTRVEGMLADRDYTIFAGHTHYYAYDGSDNHAHSHDKITLATTGGGSPLRGVDYGEFDHMAWVTMTDKGPVIANLLQDGIMGKDIPMPKQRPRWVK